MPTLAQINDAARAWLESMRRSWVSANPDTPIDCPIKPWDDYSEEDRGVLLNAAKHALHAAAKSQ